MTPADIDAMIAAAHKRARRQPTTAALVLIGEASAYPHGSHKPQVVKRGEIVLIDCACSVHGYQADISRTFVFGADPTPSSARSGTRSIAASRSRSPRRRSARRRAASTTPCAAPTKAGATARATSCPALSHRTGHGIGMEVHEPVNLVHGETTPLAPGMCFSNEPGHLHPGKFGVRLEDCFHMTESGPKFFTQPPPSIDRPFG